MLEMRIKDSSGIWSRVKGRIKVILKLLVRSQYVLVFPIVSENKLEACDIHFSGLSYKDTGSILDHASNEVWDYNKFLAETDELIKKV